MDFPKWLAGMLQRNTKPDTHVDVAKKPEVTKLEVVSSAPKEAIDTLTVFTGPKGGKYRLNAKGKKIYLSA